MSNNPAILSMLGWLVVSSCSSSEECVHLDKGSFENQELVTNLATKLGLATQNHEAGIIVGAASAIAQLEGGQQGVPVVVCLRRGDADDIEFRTLSTAGKVLDEWRSVAELSSNTPWSKD